MIKEFDESDAPSHLNANEAVSWAQDANSVLRYAQAILAKRDEEHEKHLEAVNITTSIQATLNNRMREEIDHLKAQLAMQADKLKLLSLYVAVNGDDWVKREATEALNATAEDVAKYNAEIEKSVLAPLMKLMDVQGDDGSWNVTLEYDNVHDGAKVLDANGMVIASCYDLDLSPDEQVVAAIKNVEV